MAITGFDFVGKEIQKNEILCQRKHPLKHEKICDCEEKYNGKK